jgi:hypothetical protein
LTDVLNFIGAILGNNKNKQKALEKFEYITLLDFDMICDIWCLAMGELGLDSLATALQGLDEKLQNVFFTVMSKNELSVLKENMTAMSWASQYSINDERAKILDIANAYIKSKRFKISDELCIEMSELDANIRGRMENPFNRT